MKEEEDRQAWTQEVRDITPWHVAPDTRDATPSPVLPDNVTSAKPLPLITPQLSIRMQEVITATPQQRMDVTMLRRIKSGRMRVERTLDLHDMVQNAAYDRLLHFIQDACHTHTRLVLVITGKGSVSEGGVLRKTVPRWLKEQPFSPMVIAMHKAHAHHGGNGAYYVYLRRGC